MHHLDIGNMSGKSNNNSRSKVCFMLVRLVGKSSRTIPGLLGS